MQPGAHWGRGRSLPVQWQPSVHPGRKGVGAVLEQPLHCRPPPLMRRTQNSAVVCDSVLRFPIVPPLRTVRGGGGGGGGDAAQFDEQLYRGNCHIRRNYIRNELITSNAAMWRSPQWLDQLLMSVSPDSTKYETTWVWPAAAAKVTGRL